MPSVSSPNTIRWQVYPAEHWILMMLIPLGNSGQELQIVFPSCLEGEKNSRIIILHFSMESKKEKNKKQKNKKSFQTFKKTKKIKNKKRKNHNPYGVMEELAFLLLPPLYGTLHSLISTFYFSSIKY